MRAWSDRPFPPVVDYRDVAARGAEIATESGQSIVIYESTVYPGWLIKLYRQGFPQESDEVLDRLIALPGTMSARGQGVVDQSVGWPVTRVVDGPRTVGVALAKAPEEFYGPFRLLSGETARRPIEIDHLMPLDAAHYERCGLAPPTWDERRRVAQHLLRVADLFERHGVVYGDWSYSNAFWARGSGLVFVIDVDACGLGDRAWVETNGWTVPGVEPGERLDVRADRYRVALSVLRCLSGVRGNPMRAYEALPAALRATEFGRELLTGLTASPDLRPVSGALLELLETQYDSAERNRRPHTPASPLRPARDHARWHAPPAPPLPEPELEPGWDDEPEPAPERAGEPEFVPEPRPDSEYWDMLDHNPEPAPAPRPADNPTGESAGGSTGESADDPGDEYVPEPVDDKQGPGFTPWGFPLNPRLPFSRRRTRS